MGTLKTWVVSGRHSTKSVFLMNTWFPESRYLDKCTIKICPQFIMDIAVPHKLLLQQVYKDLHKNLRKLVQSRMLDSNKMKSNLADPHFRTVTIPDIQRVLFASAYNFNIGESNRDSINVNPFFQLERQCSVFCAKTLIINHTLVFHKEVNQ